MKLEDIKRILEKYGEYRCFATNYKRFKSDKDKNRNYKKSSTIEYLHCLIKNRIIYKRYRKIHIKVKRSKQAKD
ncbi:hypothetical protein [Fusobacterium nucleatum]|uniref:hypothetical protein n=1 Tax=Fusobacterium nucleatum TaxID=851 RepID=UPI0030D0E1AC